MSSLELPYNRQCIDDDDVNAVVAALKSPFLTTGPEASLFESEIAEYVGANYAVVCANGTAALHLAMLALDLKKDEKVLTTPITFVADANAARFVGNDVVFADIEAGTANLDPIKTKEVLERDSAVRVLIPVHFAGQPVDIQAFGSLREEFDVAVVEDAAHAMGAEYIGKDGLMKKVGCCEYSDMTVFPFHPIKNITTGEGGCITTNDERLYKALLRLRCHGTIGEKELIQNSTNGFTEVGGEQIKNPWYYEMQSLGFNYRITDFQCALGRSQLRKLDSFIDRRAKLVKSYLKLVEEFFGDEITTLEVRENVKHAYHLFVVRIPFEQLRGGRAALVSRLFEKGVSTQVHYLPIYMHPYYEKTLSKTYNLMNAENYYDQCLSLPLFPCMDDDDPYRVVKALHDVMQEVTK